jgi:geranylgeranyl diphosphate synthase type I
VRIKGENIMDLKEALRNRAVLINKEIDNILDVGNQPRLKGAMRHLPLLESSKRLRPIMAVLAAEAVSDGEGGRGAQRVLPFALCLEIIHNFTLVHDDIMDNDDLRRGVKTTHVEFDPSTAINAGDALFARAFEVLSTVEIEDFVLRTLHHDVAKMVREIGEGQQWDLDFGTKTEVGVDEYLLMVELKTARIFQMAAKGGTLIGGGTKEQVESMDEYGRLVGVGFQIWDDYLDYKRSSDLKSAFSDIRQGKRTLIVLHALETLKSDEQKRNELLGILGNENASDDEVKSAVEILNSCGSLDHAKNQAQEFADKALEKLRVLSESSSRKLLEDIANYMVAGREF